MVKNRGSRRDNKDYNNKGKEKSKKKDKNIL